MTKRERKALEAALNRVRYGTPVQTPQQRFRAASVADRTQRTPEAMTRTPYDRLAPVESRKVKGVNADPTSRKALR